VADNGIKTVPFVEALMKNLKSYPVRIALATSSRREKMKLLMEKVGFLPYFDAIVTGEEVTNGKPAPDIFLQAAERLHVPAGKCMVIEDAASGVKAAKSAQMKCIAITTTHPADQLQLADLVIDSFENASLGAWCSQLK
jgi:HAD superfamily hydrolase (TIGR01509 family)